MTFKFRHHISLPEPKLAFSLDSQPNQDIHPLRGLLQFGPYSSGLVPDPIRVATITPSSDRKVLYEFMKSLNSISKPIERKEYLPNWPGFHSVFKIRMQGAAKGCHILLDSEFEDAFHQSHQPHMTLSEELGRAINQLEASRSEFDIAFIYLPARWTPGFIGNDDEDFDLHDHLKATTALSGVPIQLVREDSALKYPCQSSVMWRIGIAIYAKAGGIPWKLANTEPETACIGISYARRDSGLDVPRFVTCCSQVFDAEGVGLEFVAFDANEEEVKVPHDNPYLTRTGMFRVMTRSLDLYRRRQAGRIPRRVMVHKTTEFKKEEIEGAMEALHLCKEVDLVQVVEDVGWRGIRLDSNPSNPKMGIPNPYPVQRGTAISLSPYEVLLWTHGNVDGITKRLYFQGGKGTPKPIRLVRHAGRGPWDETIRTVLGLSKMNWNNDSLHDRLPVTMTYAKVLARTVKRMPSLKNRSSYQYRFFM